MNVWCCGGAGINIGHLALSAAFINTEGYAQLNFIFIDTSVSNLRGLSGIDPTHVYIFNGKDGSGGMRALNAKEIASSMDALLVAHKPTKHNLIVCSTAGGTGSVIAANLAVRLNKEDLIAAAIIIGDSSNANYAQNTVGAVQSFSNMIGKLPGKTLPIVALVNRHGVARASVDMAALEYIQYFACLFSDQLNALDQSDVRNWVHQENITKMKAPITLVGAVFTDDFGRVVGPKGALDKDVGAVNFDAIATVLTFLRDKQHSPLVSTGAPIPYGVCGYAIDDYAEMPMDCNVNLVTFTNVQAFYDGLFEEHSNAQKVFKSRKAPAIIAVSADMTEDDDGLVT